MKLYELKEEFESKENLLKKDAKEYYKAIPLSAIREMLEKLSFSLNKLQKSIYAI